MDQQQILKTATYYMIRRFGSQDDWQPVRALTEMTNLYIEAIEEIAHDTADDTTANGILAFAHKMREAIYA